MARLRPLLSPDVAPEAPECRPADMRSAESVAAGRLLGSHTDMRWLVVLIALIAIFGLGSLLKATFLTLIVIAAVVLFFALVIARVIGR
jgi:hypothetical protein